MANTDAARGVERARASLMVAAAIGIAAYAVMALIHWAPFYYVPLNDGACLAGWHIAHCEGQIHMSYYGRAAGSGALALLLGGLTFLGLGRIRKPETMHHAARISMWTAGLTLVAGVVTLSVYELVRWLGP